MIPPQIASQSARRMNGENEMEHISESKDLKRGMRTGLSHLAVFLLAVGGGAVVNAQETGEQGATNVVIEEVLVTARKRAEAERAQDVPLSVSAFNSNQLELLGFNNIQDLSFAVPNVSLEESGTQRGIATFSIRGLSSTSSIISIDPAVALFVDGFYLPTNVGSVSDTFDIETVEVLRGPQGTLFGKNVTGGAVNIRSKRPSQEFDAEGFARYEGGGENPTYVFGGAIQGGLSDNLSGRLAVYYSEDDGYFENSAFKADPSLASVGVPDDLGATETELIRGSLLWDISDNASFWVKYETMEQDGRPSPSQNQANFHGKDEDRVSLNYEPDVSLEYETLLTELNWDIGPGRLTNILGWREQDSNAGTDIDSTRFTRFHTGGAIEADNWSNELRYSGTVSDGALDFTVGVYYYEAELTMLEQRSIFGGVVYAEGGGHQDSESWAIFTENEYHVNDELSLLFGLRYSDEEKDVFYTEINGPNCGGPSTFPATRLYDCVISSTDSDDWQTLGGKVGFRYRLNNDVHAYGHFTRGFRSGGFNLRDSQTDGQNPPPYDEEELDAIELGLKGDYFDGKVRANLAVFHSKIDGLLRDVTIPGGPLGAVQTTANTADTTIQGVEIEGHWLITENLVFTGAIGYLDFEYDKVVFDLNGDGVVDDLDKKLEFPRAAPWTASASLTYDKQLSFGRLSARIGYNYRDEVFYTDSNATRLEELDIVNARIGLSFGDGRFEVVAFGENLLDQTRPMASNSVGAPINTPDPFFGLSDIADELGPGVGTFTPLAKGRVIGVEFKARL